MDKGGRKARGALGLCSSNRQRHKALALSILYIGLMQYPAQQLILTFLTDCSTLGGGGRGCLCPLQSLATVALQRHNTENSKHIIPGKDFCTASVPIFTFMCR